MPTVGILGGGQLGRMLALAGYPLGLHFRFLDPASNAPAAELADYVSASYEQTSLTQFAIGLDVITYEFENIPASAAVFLSQRTPLYPSPQALAITQDRVHEKEWLRSLGLATTDYVSVDNQERLWAGLATLGLPAVLKSRRLGYDGSGQLFLRTQQDTERAVAMLTQQPAILERVVPFVRELSLIAVRARDGATRYYPLIENCHADGILRCSVAPAPQVSAALQAEAERAASRILTALEYVGVLTIEFFEWQGQLLVNELAPRVHNSGHWTIEGAETSQFENHLRAILGLPLGSVQPVGYAALVNLIGTLPNLSPILQLPDTHVHLYGKEPRPKRKLGHVTVRAPNTNLLDQRLSHLQRLIQPEN